MRKLSFKVDKNTVTILDRVMCITFALLAVGGLFLVFLAEDKQLVMGCTFGLALMSLMYSPLIERNMLLRLLSIIATIFIVCY